jgi:para-aminobenzoate synthetase component I
MNTFFAHFPATKERPWNIIAKGVKDAFIIEKAAGKEDWEQLQTWVHHHRGQWIFALSSFESGFPFLKLTPNKPDIIPCPSLVWIIPEEIETRPELSFLNSTSRVHQWKFEATETKEEYLQNLHGIQQDLLRGNFYETNYCMQLAANGGEENTYSIWKGLFEKNPAPHSVYWQWNHLHLICLSPERFIQKTGGELLSQPIKGTAARSENKNDDLENKNQLQNSRKERSENTMIVDLVRNDMSKIAQKGSVTVPALCAIESFKSVHHMVSTVACQTDENISTTSIFEALFPMGSMTGVPKRISVQKMHSLEKNARGWYSGTCGWIDPKGDFDFNVIIRSIIYDDQLKISKIGIGSAITLQSNFNAEWDECWLKSQSLINQ